MDIDALMDVLDVETRDQQPPDPPYKRRRIDSRPSTIRAPEQPSPLSQVPTTGDEYGIQKFAFSSYNAAFPKEDRDTRPRPSGIADLPTLKSANLLQGTGSRFSNEGSQMRGSVFSGQQRRPQVQQNSSYFQAAVPTEHKTELDRFSSPILLSPAPSEFPSSPPPTEAAALPKKKPEHRVPGSIQLSHAPLKVQGIELVEVAQLPDRFRHIFPFPVFNAVQSRCFKTVFGSDDNLVLSSPTGSGKTVVMELAICRLVNTYGTGPFKIIYQAPTKALCAERKRDWGKKMSCLGLRCTELTGDTEHQELASVKSGDVIITTPEKWDSVTRRWHDHKKLLEMVRLFLIDEVHFLKDSRGATLEVVVSRMKSTGINVRVVALSATVPNSEDIANWLGKNSAEPEISAVEERFGEEFRPVKLQKAVYGYPMKGNDYIFDRNLDKHLPEIIKKHSAGKPIMIFCMTRNGCVSTAKNLSQLFKGGQRLWKPPRSSFSFHDKDLQETAPCGVAFHHAGISAEDRVLIERLFLEGELQIICCTGTLAVGVNLPTYLVILKNTSAYSDSGPKEYSDLEVMQMLGRAGRPQFDDAGMAVIMTKSELKQKYERMVSGTELLESCLHLNLIEHLNAEISLKAINNAISAKKWLKSTFFWVRLRKNPSHYNLEGSNIVMDVNQRLDDICDKDLNALLDASLIISDGGTFRTTDYGTAMATYCIKFETMKIILALEEHSKVSEIITAISQAKEFSDIRIRAGDKGYLRELNGSTAMKFPIKGDIHLVEHKVSILIQAEIGGVEYPPGDQFSKYQNTFRQDTKSIFGHINRVARCIVDCKLYDKDAIGMKNALEVARCAVAKCWENSPTQLKQIDGIGAALLRKLVASNIRSIEQIRKLETSRIEMALSRNPPFGKRILDCVETIPHFRVFAHLVSKTADRIGPVKANIRAEIGLLNKTAPSRHRGNVLYADFVAESEGVVLYSTKLPVYKLDGGKDMKFTAELYSPSQTIICSVFSAEYAGTSAIFELKPEIDAADFPPESARPVSTKPKLKQAKIEDFTNSLRNPKITYPTSNMGLIKKVPHPAPEPAIKVDSEDEYEDLEVTTAMDDLDFSHLSSLAFNVMNDTVRKNTALNSRNTKPTGSTTNLDDQPYEPVRLPNGKWECKHKCADKTSCKHLCCHEGMDNPPKVTKKKASASSSSNDVKQKSAAPSLTQEPISGKIKLSQVQAGSQRPGLYAPRGALEAAVKRVDRTLVASEEDNDREGTFPQSAKSSLKRLDRLHKKVGTGQVSTFRSLPGHAHSREGASELPTFLDNLIKEKLPFHKANNSFQDLNNKPSHEQIGASKNSRIAGDSDSEDYGLGDLDDDIDEDDLPPILRSDPAEPVEIPRAPVAPMRLPVMTPEQIRQRRGEKETAFPSSDEEEFFFKPKKRHTSLHLSPSVIERDEEVPDTLTSRMQSFEKQLPLFYSEGSSSTFENEPFSPKSNKPGKQLRFSSPAREIMEDSQTQPVFSNTDPEEELGEDDYDEYMQMDLNELEMERFAGTTTGADSTSETAMDLPVEFEYSKATVSGAEQQPTIEEFNAEAANEATNAVSEEKKEEVDISDELLDFLGDCVEFVD